MLYFDCYLVLRLVQKDPLRQGRVEAEVLDSRHVAPGPGPVHHPGRGPRGQAHQQPRQAGRSTPVQIHGVHLLLGRLPGPEAHHQPNLLRLSRRVSVLEREVVLLDLGEDVQGGVVGDQAAVHKLAVLFEVGWCRTAAPGRLPDRLLIRLLEGGIKFHSQELHW